MKSAAVFLLLLVLAGLAIVWSLASPLPSLRRRGHDDGTTEIAELTAKLRASEERVAALQQAHEMAAAAAMRYREEIAVGTVRPQTAAAAPADRYAEFQHHVGDYFALLRDEDERCDTQYVSAVAWCDASPGNGLKPVLQHLVLGYVLNRKLIIRMRRKDKCNGVFLDFNTTNVVLLDSRGGGGGDEEARRYVAQKRQSMLCNNHSSSITSHTIKMPASAPERMQDTLACFDFAHHQQHTTVFGIEPWTELLSDLQLNAQHLNPQELARAKEIFAIGLPTAMAVLSKHVFTIASAVKQEFEAYDYKPSAEWLRLLRDDRVLKVGIHIRHLPFVFRDEAEKTEPVDRRAFSCMARAIRQEQQDDDAVLSDGRPRRENFTDCVALIATDMKKLWQDDNNNNNGLQRLLPSFPNSPTGKCRPFFITKTSSSRLDRNLWGTSSSSTASDWETRPLGDIRGQLEAYLDFYVLSEYSHFMVTGTGSTFSSLIATYNLRRPTVDRTYEYHSTSCKEGYFAYSSCCAKRARWADVFTRQGPMGGEC